jgi:hypothetical protein
MSDSASIDAVVSNAESEGFNRAGCNVRKGDNRTTDG